MPTMHRFIMSILPVGKEYLVIPPIGLRLYKILYRTTLVFCLIVDDKGIEMINKA